MKWPWGSKPDDDVPLPALQTFNVALPTAVNALEYIYQHIAAAIRPGLRLSQLEWMVGELLKASGTDGYFKGYRGFPGLLTASLNEEVLGAPATGRRLGEKDLLKIEVGTRFRGQHACVAWTFPASSAALSEKRQHLMTVAKLALNAATIAAKDGAAVGDLSRAMDQVIHGAGCFPNRDFVGHRIGAQPHMSPPIPCYLPNPALGTRLKKGMDLVLLAIVHEKPPAIRIREDGWTVFSPDGSESVMFSRMMRVEAAGCTILTHFPESGCI